MLEANLQETLIAFNMLLVLLRVSQSVQVTSNYRLGFFTFGNRHGIEAVSARANPAVFANEVGVTGAQHHQLCEQGVVVVFLGDMA